MRTYNHVHWYIRWISMYLWIMPTLWYVICELSICTFTWSFIVLNVSVPPSLGQYSNTGLHVRVSGLHRCTGNICLLLSSSRPSQNPSQVCMGRERGGGERDRETSINYLLFYVRLENISFIWRRQHTLWRTGKFSPWPLSRKGIFIWNWNIWYQREREIIVKLHGETSDIRERVFIVKLHGETSDIVKSMFAHVFKPYLVSVLC